MSIDLRPWRSGPQRWRSPGPVLTSINVLSAAAQSVVICSDEQRRATHVVRKLEELRDLLHSLPESSAGPRRLDLLGHSTRAAKLLRLGDTAIDMCVPRVKSFFLGLAEDGVLRRLDIVALRLLGCETAVEPTGQLTMRLLARRLRIPVFGTRKILLRSHYCDHGFNPAFRHVLIESAQLPNPPQRLS